VLKLAIIGGADAYHAVAFSTLFNTGPRRSQFAGRADVPDLSSRARVVSVWDEVREPAEKLAREHEIGRVAASIAEAVDGVDGALLIDDHMDQHRWAPAMIEAGVPYFHDKPLAPTYARAQEIVQMAKAKGALMFSSSSIRHARELLAELPALRDEGGPKFAVGFVPRGEIMYYGIHALEPVLSVMGVRTKEMKYARSGSAHLVSLSWEDGREALFVMDDRIKHIALNFYTEKQAHVIQTTDEWAYYGNQMAAFLDMMETKRIPVPWEETLEVIRLLDVAQKAAGQG